MVRGTRVALQSDYVTFLILSTALLPYSHQQILCFLSGLEVYVCHYVHDYLEMSDVPEY